MSEKRWPPRCFNSTRILLFSAFAVLLAPLQALACSVCFTDKDSPMVQGAIAGVVTLIGIVGSVLTCIAGTGLFWMQRGRRLRHAIRDAGQPQDAPSDPSPRDEA